MVFIINNFTPSLVTVTFFKTPLSLSISSYLSKWLLHHSHFNLGLTRILSIKMCCCFLPSHFNKLLIAATFSFHIKERFEDNSEKLLTRFSGCNHDGVPLSTSSDIPVMLYDVLEWLCFTDDSTKSCCRCLI